MTKIRNSKPVLGISYWNLVFYNDLPLHHFSSLPHEDILLSFLISAQNFGKKDLHMYPGSLIRGFAILQRFHTHLVRSGVGETVSGTPIHYHLPVQTGLFHRRDVFFYLPLFHKRISRAVADPFVKKGQIEEYSL